MNLPVVSSSNTRSNPHAVVVKFENTIVAYITMRDTWGSEYPASLTKLKIIEHWRMYHRRIQVKYFILFVDFLIFAIHT